MLEGLMINGRYVPLVEEVETTTREGYANVEYWDGGTMVYAHNYLTGREFYRIMSVMGLLPNGLLQAYEIKKSIVYTGQDWEKVISEYSSPGSITLVTCYPEVGTTSWRYIVELRPKIDGENNANHQRD